VRRVRATREADVSRPLLYLAAFGIFVLIVMVSTIWALRRSREEVERHHQALQDEHDLKYEGEDDDGSDS
jgi:hypothetical protein